MAAIVEVKLELGHRAKVRDVPSPEGHTHDWIVFVKGSDGIKLEHFVEKVVFWLHESYEPNKRVIKRPPYKVEESGFAGFIILIDVHFRNHEQPKMVRFQYDLFLLKEGMPPVNHTRLEKLTFTNPTEDFRKKLLKAGASSSSSSPKVQPKERPRNPSSSPKKDRSRSKDSSKHRDGSSHRSHDEKKRSSSAHSIRKDGRISGKDMKKHEDEFKHPKPPDSGRTHKDSSGSEKMEQDRGRSDKRRSTTADDDGSKKKKKKHSDDRSSPSHQSRPKSLPVSSGPPSQNPPKKEKVRKIREKPDLMAGLFAPENSINMTQIKQSKEKVKQETSEFKIKKEKKVSTPNSTTSRRSVSPHPSKDAGRATHSSKISPGGNLTLKIKKERITSAEEKKKSVLNPPSKPKKKEHNEKEKRSKDSTDASSKTKMKNRESEHKKKTTPVASSSPSSSSVSGSDMDISSNGDSSSDSESKRSVSQVATKTRVKTEKVQHAPESQSFGRENQRMPGKQERKSLNSGSSGHDKVSKVKTEWERPRDSPKASTDGHEKPRRNSTSSHQEKTASVAKQKKSSRDEQTKFSVEKSNSGSSSSHKSKKRSSKEKVRQSSERKNPTTLPPPLKKEKQISTPSSTPVSEQVTVKKEPKYQTPPPSSYRMAISPASNTKLRKSPKPSSAPPKEKEKVSKKQTSSHRKLSTSSSAKPSSEHYEKSKQPKSRSFVESSSDSDSDVEPPLKHVSLGGKREELARKDSMSSQSSTSSSQPTPSPSMSPVGVRDKNQTQVQQEYHQSPSKKRKDSASSNSDSSDDEEMAMREFPPNTSAISVISPIRDQSSSYIQNPKDTGNAFQDMEMSDSSDDNTDRNPMQGNIQENHHPSGVEEDRCTALQNIGVNNDDYSSSSEDENRYPPEKPFQNHQDSQDLHSRSSTSNHGDSPNVIIMTGDTTPCPAMTDSFYRELQDLQKRISYVTDVERLRKIARIVAKSHKLLKNDDYFDFDLCSLDTKTIHKIQKQLEAV